MKRGFHIQTTPLDATFEKMKAQVDAFHRGKAELGKAGEHLRLALSRVCVVAKYKADAERKTSSWLMNITAASTMSSPDPASSRRAPSSHLPLKQTIEEFSQQS